LWLSGAALLANEDSVVGVFIFAGRSNMVAADVCDQSGAA